MMEVVVTTGAIRRAKLQSNRHNQQTNCLQAGWMSSVSLKQQCQSVERMNHLAATGKKQQQLRDKNKTNRI